MKKINYLEQLVIERDNFYAKQNFFNFLIFIFSLPLFIFSFIYIEKKFKDYSFLGFMVQLFSIYIIFIVIAHIFIYSNKEKGFYIFNIPKLNKKIILIKEKNKISFKEKLQNDCILNEKKLKDEIKKRIYMEHNRKKGILESLTFEKILFGIVGSILVNLFNEYFKSIFNPSNKDLNLAESIFYEHLVRFILVILFIIIIVFFSYIFFKQNYLYKLYELEEILDEISNRNSKKFIVEVVENNKN